MTINLSILTEEEINIDFGTEAEVDFDFGLDACYTGSYEATPSLGEQTIPTANKTMLSDIHIDPIPVSKVISPQGSGYTVTIG